MDGGDEGGSDGFCSPFTSEVPEYHEAGGAFDQCRDRRSTQRADDEITLRQWKGLNKPHRQDRRWVKACSPEQISNRLPIDFPG